MRVFKTDEEFGLACAREIQNLLSMQPDAVISIAAGTTSIPVFEALIQMIKEGKVSFAKAAFFGMDEWLGLPQDADGAMADFLRKHFLNEAGFLETFLFDGMADPDTETARAEEFLSGHPLDLVLFGIGVNGHVALNEPGADPSLGVHIADVTETTATAAVKYFEKEAPKLEKGITIGIGNVKNAKRILLTANTENKRPAVKRILDVMQKGESENIPSSAYVARLPQTELYITGVCLERELLSDAEIGTVTGGTGEQVGNWFCPHWFKRVTPGTCRTCKRKDTCKTYKKHRQ